jgi:hypothetical protein
MIDVLKAAPASGHPVAQDRESKRQTDWAERDLALILTALLGGLRGRTRPGQCI